MKIVFAPEVEDDLFELVEILVPFFIKNIKGCFKQPFFHFFQDN